MIQRHAGVTYPLSPNSAWTKAALAASPRRRGTTFLPADDTLAVVNMNQTPEQPPRLKGKIRARWRKPSRPPYDTAAIARLAILVTAGIALLNLWGWLFHITLFTSVETGWQAMSRTTAVCFLFVAGALLSLSGDPSPMRRLFLVHLPAILVGLVGLATVILYGVSLTSGREVLDGRIPLLSLLWSESNRLALLTAALFVCTAIALGLLAGKGGRAVNCAHFIMVAVGLAGYQVVIGYLLGIKSLHRLLHVSVALNTGLAFCAVSIAILHLHPHSRLMRVWASIRAGGVMARRLFPAILLFPLAISWLRLYGEMSGLFGLEAGVALVALTYAILLLGLLWLTADSVNRSDEQVELAERQFSTFFALTPDLVATAGLDGRFRQLSPSWEATLGWPQEEMVGRSVFSLVHPDDRLAAEEVAHRLAAGEMVRQFVNRYRHKDGSYHWIEWFAVPIEELGVIYGAARDITERIRIEGELTDSRRELSAMLENAPIVILLVDREQRIRKANTATSGFGGLSHGEVVGRRCGEALRCLHATETVMGCGFGSDCENCTIRRTVEETFATGRNRQGVEASVPFDEDGRPAEFTFLLSTSLLTLSGEQLCLVCIENITDRKQAERALQRAHDELELRVQERTRELVELNKALAAEIDERLRAETKVRRFTDELEQRVRERTAELEGKNAELEQLNRLFVGRELRMMELKSRIRELESLAGKSRSGMKQDTPL